MISSDEALRIARDYLRTEYPKLDLVITHTLERRFGWAFGYQSREWVEFGEENAMVVGGGPLLVLRSDGSVVVLWTGQSLEDELSDYAKSHNLLE